MGMPGWPEFAFWTASIARPRMMLAASAARRSSSDAGDELGTTGGFVVLLIFHPFSSELLLSASWRIRLRPAPGRQIGDTPPLQLGAERYAEEATRLTRASGLATAHRIGRIAPPAGGVKPRRALFPTFLERVRSLLSARCGLPRFRLHEDPALPDIRLVDPHELLRGNLAPGGDQPGSLPQLDAVDRIAHAPRVGEERLLPPELEVFPERFCGGRIEKVALRPNHQLSDRHQLLEGVIGEVDVMGDAGTEARVRGEEGRHPVPIPRKNHNQVVAIILHRLQKNRHRLDPIVALALGPIEGVGLIDEENPAHRPLDRLLGLRGGMADVLADQIVPGGNDQVAFPHVAQPVEDLAHPHSYRGLPGPRRTGKRHVQGRRLGLQTDGAPQPLHQEKIRDLPNPALDRLQTNELGVEFGQNLLDPGAPERLIDINQSTAGSGRQRGGRLGCLPLFFHGCRGSPPS
ncbi:protein of unknown function [Methylacidimicrobium sp. AP8]|nr:protein of unknown function [Methylacidimicrobium sp. AP8]